jgi:pimeloyl-ACP methyl ester carboxylesterase
MDRLVSFFSEGVKLAGVLRVPDQARPGEKLPAVICCQGFGLVKEVWLPNYARALNRAGYITLNLDYRGFGESGGEPRCRLVPQAQVEDIRNALTFLETVPEVDSARMGLFGISLGASVATACAGKDPRAKALVAVAGPGDLERVWSSFPDFPRFRAKVHRARQAFVASGEITYVSVVRLLASDAETCAMMVADAPKHPTWRLEISFESLEDLFAFKPEDDAPTMRAASLFLYPEADTLIAKSEMLSMCSKAPWPKQIVGLAGLKHHEVYNDGAGFEPVMRHTLEFLDARLAR